jgi:hypothetical protein
MEVGEQNTDEKNRVQQKRRSGVMMRREEWIKPVPDDLGNSQSGESVLDFIHSRSTLVVSTKRVDYHNVLHPEKFSSQPSPHSPWLRCCMSTKTLLPADLHRLDTIEARDRREAESPKASVPPAQSQFVMKCCRLGVEQVAWSSGSSSTPITGRCFYRAMTTDARSDVGRCSVAAFWCGA